MIVAGILLCTSILIGASYAWWSYIGVQTSINTINSNCLRVDLVDETSAITMEKSYPITDTEANMLTPYRFTVKNVCETSVLYDVELDIMESKNASGEDIRLKSEYIAISFDGAAKQMLSTVESITPSYNKSDYKAVEGRKLTSGSLSANESKTYTIKLWIDEHVTVVDDAMNKQFISKIVVNARLNQITEYRESILNGAYPVLAENLIPVEISDIGVVTKANLSNEWYSYEKKKWANAVILLDKTITYADNETIPEENIESYFVWIPKYSYQLWDLGNYEGVTSINTAKVHIIPIKFGTENTNDANSGECTTPMGSGLTGNCTIGDYMTPPAFITMGTNGLWVGKFETGYKGATTTAGAQANVFDPNKVQIKPNVYSWRNIQVANMHLTSYNYHREMDSHMMKNTEWGAVAYLSHSKYGIGKEVRINNNSNYVTGYAATAENGEAVAVVPNSDASGSVNYKNANSVVASTTGNYTGIYDMSGGAHEYVMGVMLNSTNVTPLSGKNTTTHSNFNGPLGESGSISGQTDFPNTKYSNTNIYKYFDTYEYGTSYTVYQRRILGDATGEFGPFATSNSAPIGSWYGDLSYFVHSLEPWCARSLTYNNDSGAGVFGFYRFIGQPYVSFGFRIVLAI